MRYKSTLERNETRQKRFAGLARVKEREREREISYAILRSQTVVFFLVRGFKRRIHSSTDARGRKSDPVRISRKKKIRPERRVTSPQG